MVGKNATIENKTGGTNHAFAPHTADRQQGKATAVGYRTMAIGKPFTVFHSFSASYGAVKGFSVQLDLQAVQLDLPLDLWSLA